MSVMTMDIDWAPDVVIEYTLSLLEKYGVKCTIFATHKTDALLFCNRDLFEIGIHPNILNAIDCNDVVEELLSIYPEAKGVRSHGLVQGSKICNQFANHGLEYVSNYLIPYYVKPFKLWNGMYQVPYNWEDDVHLMYGYSYDIIDIIDIIDTSQFNIFNFHPIHIYLNTDILERYEEAKNDIDNLESYRNKKEKGIEDFFTMLLENKQQPYNKMVETINGE